MDSIVLYDDDNDCGDDCHAELDYEYEQEFEQESLNELYQFCLVPSIYDTFWYMLPLFITAAVFNVATNCSYISRRVFHLVSTATGIYIIGTYADESLYLIIPFSVLSYVFLRLPKKFRKDTRVFLPSIITVVCCELFMNPVTWHKMRGIVMIAVMKSISVGLDRAELDEPVDLWEFTGYMFCGINCLFGPWTSIENYSNLFQKVSWKIWGLLAAAGYAFIAFFFLSVSNCWTAWILSDTAGKWLVAYRDALSFRTSHYFISFMASSLMLIGGFSLSQSKITKPTEIEIPRSLVQVVISWNIPMHCWLKNYIFRPGRRQLGKFGAVIMTYLASALLHGLNFQLASVLLSLGFYTYIEYQIRNLLANVFDACIGAKQCVPNKCTHSRTLMNSYWVALTNSAFGLLAIFHLAYLGVMFDTSELQETGYSYKHTVEKWSQLDFASHWVAAATYFIYFLIR